ncbi:MAG: DUF4394 domain-containing protein [Pyrinomonadaceae bacterium]|nr:DUF4394 domain-containing protein [Pyrinomonadaceae bacterium]
MNKGFVRRGLWIAPCLAIIMIALSASAVHAVPVFGITTTNQLVRFDSATPGTINTSLPVTGLQAGETIVGIDFRPANGQLYGVGSTSRIYIINTTTGAATQVGAAVLSPALNGTAFGVDFNPVPDRLRIVSDADQNLRVNPADGVAVNDGTIAFMAGDVNAGQNPNVVAAAYINNFNGATTTTLYDIDSNLDILVTQNPANNGTLQTVGALGVNTTDLAGFDITTSGATNTAYAALNLVGDTVTKFYTINLATGAATPAGTIGGAIQLRGIAVGLVPIASQTAFALTNSNRLVRFNTVDPGTALSAVSIGNLNIGDQVLAIDFRPATGQLYGMVRDLLGTSYRLVIINPTTGATTAVAPVAPSPTGSFFGFDFNPVPDRIRIISDADQNLRVNPADGVALVDGTLAYAAGDTNVGQNPNVAGAGYANNFTGTASTTLYDIDTNLDILVTQNPPNNGTLNTVGTLGVDTTNLVGFDIGSANNAFAALTLATDPVSKLYTINLTTGRATLVGNIDLTVSDGIEQVIGLAIGGNDAVVDYDGDGRTDYSVFRLSNNFFYVLLNGTGGNITQQFGQAGSDIQTPGDYDGDGRTDFAVWRESTGTFFVLRSSNNTLLSQAFGQPGDEPVARDYDGDNRTDFAVVRRTGGQMVWYILNSANGSFRAEQFGLVTDIVAPGDYDGDERFDLAVQRNSGGQSIFFILQSTAGFRGEQFGLAGDLNVPGDYDGDGKTDIAVYRAGTTSFWYIRQSSDNGFRAVQFGTKGDFTVQGDYDGDGETDVAVYRPSLGTFFVLQSSNGLPFTQRWGTNEDYPVANFDTH